MPRTLCLIVSWSAAVTLGSTYCIATYLFLDIIIKPFHNLLFQSKSGFTLEESGYVSGSAANGARFGTTIAGLGDVNGDGFNGKMIPVLISYLHVRNV